MLAPLWVRSTQGELHQVVEALREEKAIAGDRVLEGCRKGVLGREPVAESEGARLSLAPGLSQHMAVARDGAGDVAAAVQEQDDVARIRLRGGGPFGGDAVGHYGLDADIFRDPVLSAQRIEPLSPLGQAGRPRARGQHGPDDVDLWIGHGSPPRRAPPPRLCASFAATGSPAGPAAATRPL
jgi:hypothetical protein